MTHSSYIYHTAAIYIYHLLREIDALIVRPDPFCGGSGAIVTFSIFPSKISHSNSHMTHSSHLLREIDALIVRPDPFCGGSGAIVTFSIFPSKISHSNSHMTHSSHLLREIDGLIVRPDPFCGGSGAIVIPISLLPPVYEGEEEEGGGKRDIIMIATVKPV